MNTSCILKKQCQMMTMKSSWSKKKKKKIKSLKSNILVIDHNRHTLAMIERDGSVWKPASKSVSDLHCLIT